MQFICLIAYKMHSHSYVLYIAMLYFISFKTLIGLDRCVSLSTLVLNSRDRYEKNGNRIYVPENTP